MSELGQFESLFTEWRSMLATIGQDARGPVYMRMLYDVAQHVKQKGLHKALAVDELLETGEAHGLGSREELEMFIGDIFVQVESEPPISFESNGGKQPRQAPGPGPQQAPPLPLPKLQSKAEFLAALTPPEYLIENILQRGFIYALTGLTQAGKTAVALLIAQLVSSADHNARLGRYQAEKGRVIYFVGENPDEVRMRVLGMDKKRDDDPSKDNITFIPGVFDIGPMMTIIEVDLKRNGEAALIVVDTSAAYFLQDDENSNTMMGAYARKLRSLTTLTGNPTVLVLCHPPKNVDEPSKLIPRGGGAYLNEMDANLTLWLKSEDVAEMSYTKLRGHPWPSITFQLEKIFDVMRDKKDRPMGTVRAVVISQEDQEKKLDTTRTDENKLLALMLKMPDGSTRRWAEELQWFYGNGVPDHTRVDRMLKGLGAQTRKKLVYIDRKKWGLTEEGKKVARDAGAALQRMEVAAAPELFSRKEIGLRPVAPIQVGSITLQIIGPEPDHVCSYCNRREPQVYLIRAPSLGVDSIPLHEQCAPSWFLRK